MADGSFQEGHPVFSRRAMRSTTNSFRNVTRKTPFLNQAAKSAGDSLIQGKNKDLLEKLK
jgi:hypothetical protein